MIRSTPPGRRPPMRRGTARIAAALVLAAALAGCQVLSAAQFLALAQLNDSSGYGDPSGDPFASDYPYPSDFQDPCASADATTSEYTKGTATATLTGGASERLALNLEYGEWASAGTSSECGGTQVQFQDDSGWMLVVSPEGVRPLGPSGGDVNLLLIHNSGSTPALALGRHCSLTYTENDAKGLVGSAACTGVVFQDGTTLFDGSTPGPSPSGAAFDLKVGFEARP